MCGMTENCRPLDLEKNTLRSEQSSLIAASSDAISVSVKCNIWILQLVVKKRRDRVFSRIQAACAVVWQKYMRFACDATLFLTHDIPYPGLSGVRYSWKAL